MLKRPIAQLLAATCFQFYVSIVDPSILAQPLGPAAPSPDPAAINTVAAPAVPATPAPKQGSQTGTAGRLRLDGHHISLIEGWELQTDAHRIRSSGAD
jgi:hypothetical protein